MTTLTIRHANGSTDTIAQTVRTEIKREIGKMRRGRFVVERSLADAANLEPKSDVIEIPNDDNLRLVDVENGGSTWTLVGYSFEWDANTVPPTDGGETRTGSDFDIISGFVTSVPSWTAAAINGFVNNLTFVFNHANPSEAIRRVEKNVPGEIRFRNEGTVDYVQRLGNDRSASVTLSASAGTIEDTIEITERGRKLDGTHIRVLGAHEGQAQLFANLVPSGDPNSYDNDVRYSTTRWSSSSDTEWNRFVNKDVTDQATIDQEAAELGQELKDSLVEAKATVSGVDLNVGDTVQVVKSDADLNRDMRVHRITEIQQGATETAEVLLSTRTTLRTDESDDLKDIQRFNSGFQGASVVVQGGGSRQPVNASVNATESFRYPDVDFENTALLEVKGLPYRAFSSGAANNSDFQTIEESTDSYTTTSFAKGSGFQTASTFTPSVDTAMVFTDFFYTDQGNDNTGNHYVRLRNQTTGTTFGGDRLSFESDRDNGFFGIIPENCNGDTIAWEIDPQDEDKDFTHGARFAAAGLHTHDADPGITQFLSETPSNVDILINGSTVASNIGSGSFETVVDITTELNQDAWNTIEASSDSLGHVKITPFIESYLQIGGK